MTEAQIQRAVFENLKSRAFPSVVFWHCPNGPDSRRKSGYLAGVADVNAVHRGKFYGIELKKTGGRATEEQLEWRDRIKAAGGYAVVAEGLDEALAILEAWNLIRKEAA